MCIRDSLKGFSRRESFLHSPVTRMNLGVAKNILTMPVDEQGGVPRGTRPPLQKCRQNRQVEVGRCLSERAHPWIVTGDGHLLPPRPSSLVIRATGVTDLPHLWQDCDVRPLSGGPRTYGQSLFEVGLWIATGGRIDREPAVGRSPLHYAARRLAPGDTAFKRHSRTLGLAALPPTGVSVLSPPTSPLVQT